MLPVSNKPGSTPTRRPWGIAANVLRGPARMEPAKDARGPGRDGQRPTHGQAPAHFERRDERAPRAFDKAAHGGRANANARTGERSGEKFSHRGPKQIGGGFKPHSAKKRG